MPDYEISSNGTRITLILTITDNQEMFTNSVAKRPLSTYIWSCGKEICRA